MLPDQLAFRAQSQVTLCFQMTHLSLAAVHFIKPHQRFLRVGLLVLTALQQISSKQPPRSRQHFLSFLHQGLRLLCHFIHTDLLRWSEADVEQHGQPSFHCSILWLFPGRWVLGAGLEAGIFVWCSHHLDFFFFFFGGRGYFVLKHWNYPQVQLFEVLTGSGMLQNLHVWSGKASGIDSL